MHILVIDRESLTNQLIAAKLQAMGHTVVVEPSKNDAFDKIRLGKFDCIMFDPAPLSDARPVMLGIWKNTPKEGPKPYLIMLSKTATAEEAIAAGTNDVLTKPFSSTDIETKIGNAERLLEINRHLANDDNVHSSGGMIGKAAFNQLFLSAIDRTFRYAERSVVVFISFSNHDDIIKKTGDEGMQDILAKLTEKLTFMRRQSDVIGRLGVRDFAILLQRPHYETEPLDAFARFCEILEKFYQSFDDKTLAPTLEVSLVSLPQGSLLAESWVPEKTES